MRSKFSIIYLIILLSFSCSEKGKKNESIESKKHFYICDFPWLRDIKIEPVQNDNYEVVMPITKALINHYIARTTDSLIPINLFKYDNLPFFCPQDTILPDGWKIQFMVKNDSTKYHDVYIRCSKNEKSYVFFCQEFPSWRPCFIPNLSGSNTDFIFFRSGCVTTSTILMVLDKNHPENSEMYSPVIDFDIKTNKVIVWSSENGSDLIILDIRSGKTVSIKYNIECNDPINWSSHCVDSVKFSTQNVTVYIASGEIFNAEF
ncbi:hypothetical protein SDC9_71580 [bioreactor metagenome]|uniref:Uncharacterized protein n=1 Tax=bioreactor metagenome TaxID=1076179 RepID=A0A644Y9C7_9ZZZZ